MKQFEQLAKQLSKNIVDPFERSDTKNELLSHMYDLYESNLKVYSKDVALEKTISHFNDQKISEDLHIAHTNKINKARLFTYIKYITLFVITLYILIFLIFS